MMYVHGLIDNFESFVLANIDFPDVVFAMIAAVFVFEPIGLWYFRHLESFPKLFHDGTCFLTCCWMTRCRIRFLSGAFEEKDRAHKCFDTGRAQACAAVCSRGWISQLYQVYDR